MTQDTEAPGAEAAPGGDEALDCYFTCNFRIRLPAASIDGAAAALHDALARMPRDGVDIPDVPADALPGAFAEAARAALREAAPGLYSDLAAGRVTPNQGYFEILDLRGWNEVEVDVDRLRPADATG